MKHTEKKGVFTQIAERNWQFAGSFVFVFVVSFVFLAALGAVPQSPSEDTPTSSVQTSGSSYAQPEAPVSVRASTIGLSASVANPQSTDIGVLDAALLKGAVRYPGSALLGESGNVLIFGHSSYLALVSNSAYKTFNNIQKLRTGDYIDVAGAFHTYRYRVTGVRVAKATNTNEVIDLSVSQGKRLTLVTCDSFGTKSDRFVVEAEFVGVL